MKNIQLVHHFQGKKSFNVKLTFITNMWNLKLILYLNNLRLLPKASEFLLFQENNNKGLTGFV